MTDKTISFSTLRFFLLRFRSVTVSSVLLLLLADLFFLPLKGLSQTGTSSPYSIYGIGDLNQGNIAFNLGMGGTALGVSYLNQINPLNPASYTSVELTTFTTGINSTFLHLQKTGTSSEITNNASMACIAMAFPIPGSRKWASSFGLVPVSSVGYKISDKSFMPETGKTVRYLYEGSGGLSKFYIGNAYHFNDHFAAGANVAYLFGNIGKTRTVEFSDSLNMLFSRITNNLSLGGIHVDLGMQYTQKVSEHWVLTTGITGSPSLHAAAKYDTLAERYKYNSFGLISVIDTVSLSSGNDNAVTLPSYFGFGVSIKNEHWLIAADFSSRKWSGFSVANKNQGLQNSSRFAAGLEYSANPSSPKHYREQIHYRFGFYRDNTFLELQNYRLKEYGITFGLGLPFKRAGSTLNLSFDLSQRGTLSNGLIQERFVRCNAAFTINDKWFIPRKFD